MKNDKRDERSWEQAVDRFEVKSEVKSQELVEMYVKKINPDGLG